MRKADSGITPPVFEYVKPLSLIEFSRSRIMPTGLPYSFDQCPYFLPICEALDDVSHTCRVIVTTCSQSGKTTVLENFIGKNAVYNPRNTLIVFDTSTNARTFSTTRLRPFLKNHCHLKVFDQLGAGDDREARSKSASMISLGSGSTIMMGGSRSSADLCSRSVPILCLDECARFADLATEGDSISLALRRTVRFRSSMVFISSTPTIETGSITTYYNTGTQELWCVECSSCHNLFDVDYFKIDWSGDVPTTSCPHCGVVFSEADIRALPHRFAPPANATPYSDRYGRVARSFAIHAEIGSFYSWDDLRMEHVAALRVGESSVRSFTNTVLGRVYTPPSESRLQPEVFIEGESKLCRYDLQTVPSWVSVVVGGADVQDSELIVELVGFSEDGRRCAGLGIKRFFGDTSLSEPWKQLTDYVVGFACKTVDGRVLKPRLVCIDSGGHRTATVYALSLACPIFRCVKGSSTYAEKRGGERAIVERLTTRTTYIGASKAKIALIFVGTIYGKSRIATEVRKTAYSENPQDEDWIWSDDPLLGYASSQYWDELTSNVEVQTDKGIKYVLAAGAHDESLDCRNYALCAFELVRQFGQKLPALTLEIQQAGETRDYSDEVENVMTDLNAPPEKPKHQIGEKEIEAIKAKRAETKAESERNRTVNGTFRRKFKKF